MPGKGRNWDINITVPEDSVNKVISRLKRFNTSFVGSLPCSRIGSELLEIAQHPTFTVVNEIIHNETIHFVTMPEFTLKHVYDNRFIHLTYEQFKSVQFAAFHRKEAA